MTIAITAFTNAWRCGHPRCRTRASGIGDPKGLRALGWQVKHGSGRQPTTVLCPLHRTDRTPCTDPFSHGVGSLDATCSLCAAEREAKGWQAWIGGQPAGETLGPADDAFGDPDHGEEASWT